MNSEVKKQRLKKIWITICCLIVSLSLTFGIAINLLSRGERKDSVHIRGYFYEPQNTVDVVLIGASEVYTGFNSPLAWNEFGFTSYAIAYACMPGSVYKSVLSQALTTQSPKLVMFEINGFINGDLYLKNVHTINTWLDNAPKINDKANNVAQITSGSDKMNTAVKLSEHLRNSIYKRLSYGSTVGKYKMDKAGISYTKCFATTTSRKSTSMFSNYSPKLGSNSEKCLRDLLQYCNDVGLKNVLFYRNPHCFNNSNPECYQNIASIVNEYGYDFVSFENSFAEMGLIPSEDFYNDDHVNIYGAEKTTRYIGQYIVDRYNVKTEHSQEDKDRWNLCVEKMNTVIDKAKNDFTGGRKKVYYEISAY